MEFNRRFAVVFVLLTGTALFLHARNSNEVIPAREKFGVFPWQLGEWTGTDETIPQDALAVLGPGDFLLRSYQTSSAATPPVDLFMAYFPSQRTGDTIHSPKHCLPGAGWLPIESGKVMLTLPGWPTLPANRYLIGKGDERALVIYWFLSHDRAVTSEYWAKFYLIRDSILLNRSDGSLIRVTTELQRGEPARVAQQRLESVLSEVTPVLDQYVPH